jgi:hypothetical protein
MLGAPFSDVLGSPTAPPYLAFLYSARIINIPERRSDFAKLRS